MSNTRTDLRTLTRAADSLGVALPKKVQAAIDARLVLPPSVEEAKATAALRIAEAPGDEAVMLDALQAVAIADGATGVRRRATEVRESIVWNEVIASADAVVAAFGKILTPDFDALTSKASLIRPERAPGSLDGLPVEEYAAVFETTTAWSRIEPALAALAPLLPTSNPLGLAEADARRLALFEVPESLTGDAALAFVTALKGERRSGVSTRPAYWWAALAGLGVESFGLQSRETRSENVRRLSSAWDDMNAAARVRGRGQAIVA